MEHQEWNLLIVDDESDVHTITDLALKNKSWKSRKIKLSHAHSAKEAKEILREEPDKFHVAVIDVVMETNEAGLELCEYVRLHCSPSLRIVLRTGQPGVAPEEKILHTYDIDYYLAKSEATQQKLFTVVRACLRTSEDIVQLEDNNIALTVKNAELARLDQFRQAVLNNIGDPNVGAIAEILHHSQVLSEIPGLPLTARRSSAALIDAAKRIQEVFRPYEFYMRAELVLQSKKMLILLANERAQKLTMQALVGTTATVLLAKTVQEANDHLRSGTVDLLYVDWDHVDLIKTGMKHNPELRAILLVSENLFERHGSEILNLPISSVVVSQVFGGDIQIDPLAINELVVTAGKLLSGDIFGLEKYLAWGTAIREQRLVSSDQRAGIVQKVEDYAANSQMSTSSQRGLATLVDELMANAVFDAPVTSLNQAKYQALSRAEKVELSPAEIVTVRYGSDGNRFGLSVTDNFGRLERDLAVKYIMKCLTNSDDTASFKSNEQGMGLTYAFLAVSTFIINVLPQQRTEVIGLLNMRGSRKKHNRSFHYFRQAVR